MNEIIPTIFWNDRDGKLHLTERFNTCEVVAIIDNITSCDHIPSEIKKLRNGRMIRNINGNHVCIVTCSFFSNETGIRL